MVCTTKVEGQHNSWIGRTISGRYQILDVIGEGGMGVIFRARQLSVDRIVAVKMMLARVSNSQEGIDRFHSEAKACSRLVHPNTVRLYDFGQTTLGNLYMVMELLEGKSLRQVITDEAPLQAPRVLRILMQCAASLAEAHAAGIIHRDIKPENIFVHDLAGAPDFVKLLDFSIAKLANAQLTTIGAIFGTPQYMSPEQATGLGIDARSDIYSLGIVAYAMLSKTLPFHDPDPIKVLKMHKDSPVPPLPAHVPDMVRKVVMGCLRKHPEQRPASALALLEACRVWLTVLDPNLDIASDPILKNTIFTPGPPPSMPTELLSRAVHTGSAGRRPSKTMLSASGQQRRASTQNAAALAEEADTKTPMDSVMTTLRHGSAMVAPVPAGPSQDANVAQASAGGVNGTHATAQLRTKVVAAPVPNAPTPPAVASEPGAQVSSVDGAPTGNLEGHEPPAIRAPLPDVAASVSAPLPGPAEATPLAPVPIPQQSSTASFFLLCLLVAMTFGFGGYYITQALR
ncbi:MAG: protein kinase [Myxococcales bacterium]|nr:protein kinase [Myxococcales bacterium]